MRPLRIFDFLWRRTGLEAQDLRERKARSKRPDITGADIKSIEIT